MLALECVEALELVEFRLSLLIALLFSPTNVALVPVPIELALLNPIRVTNANATPRKIDFLMV